MVGWLVAGFPSYLPNEDFLINCSTFPIYLIEFTPEIISRRGSPFSLLAKRDYQLCGQKFHQGFCGHVTYLTLSL